MNKTKTKSQPEAPASDILNKKQAAALIGVTPKYLDSQIRAGKLKLVRIRRSDIYAWLDAYATMDA
jgi:hypothetical protein